MTNAPKTQQNLEAALAGESMAHIKYTYFARICRAHGDEETARVFEATPPRRCSTPSATWTCCSPSTPSTRPSAWRSRSRRDLRVHRDVPKLPPYPVQEQQHAAVQEFDGQIAESMEHAEQFKAVLEKAAKRFAALAKVEERHANHYRETLARARGAPRRSARPRRAAAGRRALPARPGASEYAGFRGSSLETVRQMVAEGIGLTLMPQLAAGDDAAIRYLPLSIRRPRAASACSTARAAIARPRSPRWAR